jgi:predicted DNA-binding transcriptional regulator AlpA
MPTVELNQKLLSRSQVLRQLNISGETLRRWVRDGLFPRGIRFGPRRLFWPADAVSKWRIAQITGRAESLEPAIA